MSKNEPRVLIVDVDTDSAQRMGLALDGVGMQVSWCTFSPKEFSELQRDFQPTVLLVHAEIGSPQLATLLARADTSGSGPITVALLCKDTSDEVFVRPFKSGIVEMLQEPFSARLHIGKLRMLLAELPERAGKLRGHGGPNEINGLLQHIMRTRRTGGLVLGEESGHEGRAFFVRGVLKSARYEQQSMQAALVAMSRARTPWSFTEGAEGNAGVVDLEPEGEVSDSAVVPMTVPQAPSPAALEAQAAVSPEAAKTPVLFVDDDPAVVKMLSSYLSKKGYPVSTARDGVEALTLLTTGRFEVVIADLNMPRLDGWGLLRMIREDFRTHEMPVALFSAQDDYRESLRLLHAGAQAYFPKTLKLSVLEAQVKELAEPRRRFMRLLPSEGGLNHDFGALGPQWVLRALADERFSGQLDARDAWGTWRAWFGHGRLVQMTARVGPSLMTGDRALAVFLSSKQAAGSLSKEGRAGDDGFAGHSTESTLNRLVPWLNDEQRRAREDSLQKAKALTVHDELYKLYLAVGPPAWLPIARMLCEQKMTPAEVITRLQTTPMEVAAVVKDLLRRGVASLQ